MRLLGQPYDYRIEGLTKHQPNIQGDGGGDDDKTTELGYESFHVLCVIEGWHTIQRWFESDKSEMDCIPST